MKPHEFWSLTYAEFTALYSGYIQSQKRRTNELLYVAWHTAAFERQKRLPALKDVLIDEETHAPKKQQTPEEMMAMCRLLNAAFGGDEVEA